MKEKTVLLIGLIVGLTLIVVAPSRVPMTFGSPSSCSVVTDDPSGDGMVDIVDLAIVAAAFGANFQGSPNYNPAADLNHDASVDMTDLVIVASHFGEASVSTFCVQEYGVSVSPQGTIVIGKMYYTSPSHSLTLQLSTSTDITMDQVLSDGRTFSMTRFTITPTPSWFIIPGWNCGYSDDNGRAETTQLVSSEGVIYSLNYDCIYPPTWTNITFTGITDPVHMPCTYVGNEPASCTSYVA